MSKIKVAIVFGGKSGEHEISIRSAQNVIEAIDKEKFELNFIAIDKSGAWFTKRNISHSELSFPLSIAQFDDPLFLSMEKKMRLFVDKEGKEQLDIDVFFPVLHGPNGEDGSIQGFFRVMNAAIVGSDVLGSSVGMDKDIMKKLFIEAGLPIGKYIPAFRDNVPSFAEVRDRLGMPVFIKPANLGSSVGISRVDDESAYSKAIDLAFDFDAKIVIEEFIDGKEIECAVLGNRNPKASAVGWVKSTHDFYTYESKYLDDEGYELIIPAGIDPLKQEEIRKLAIRVFEVLNANGLGRVDVFLQKDGKVIVNEMNTMPGFTSISMYPMLWKESGLSYSKLIDKLIQLGLERHKEINALKTSI